MNTIATVPESPYAPTSPARIDVETSVAERLLFVVCLLFSLLVWLLALVSVVGILCAAFLGVFVFLMHVTFVTHVRGSSVRLGPDQFPDLFQRVESLSLRMGMKRVPEVYLIQAGGSINAFATRFLGTNFVVLFSDLLDACGDDEGARDMIITHELGHVRAGTFVGTGCCYRRRSFLSSVPRFRGPASIRATVLDSRERAIGRARRWGSPFWQRVVRRPAPSTAKPDETTGGPEHRVDDNRPVVLHPPTRRWSSASRGSMARPPPQPRARRGRSPSSC